MSKEKQDQHQLRIQKLLVSIHFVTLFRDELRWLDKSSSLQGTGYSTRQVKEETQDILQVIESMDKQTRLIQSIFWYDEPSFKLMDRTLEVVENWLKGIEAIFEICQKKELFQAIIRDKRNVSFAVLSDVYTSLIAIYRSLQDFDDQTQAQVASLVAKTLTNTDTEDLLSLKFER
ncbi:hypothetical protein [Streptococcus sp. zg-JUN1979]|uniref:hypothetical protein n=1 Tax=Streptococcus sp. zg-JUN1979 TaxID=3391450 RepID=UPI0039A54C86